MVYVFSFDHCYTDSSLGGLCVYEDSGELGAGHTARTADGKYAAATRVEFSGARVGFIGHSLGRYEGVVSVHVSPYEGCS